MKTLKKTAAALLTILLLLLLYGAAIEPRFLLDVQRHDAEVPNLPADWSGRTVALLADFQTGMWLDNSGMVARAVDEALEADPALVLIAGDFLYKPDSAVVRRAVTLVRPLVEAGVPVAAVLGNHDYSLMKETSQKKESWAMLLASELEGMGVRVLRNEAVPMTPEGGGDPVYIVGIGSKWAGNSHPGQALAGVPEGAARIVFMHNPVAYRELPAGEAPLTLAAHTHGGQVRVPFTPNQSWLDIAQPREVVAEGWAVDSVGAPGNRLYVNRGMGFSVVPVRIFCRPELTLFRLRPAGGTLPDRGA